MFPISPALQHFYEFFIELETTANNHSASIQGIKEYEEARLGWG